MYDWSTIFAINDYPACENPTLVDLDQRVEMIGRNFPGVPRRVTKRDVSEAFERVATHPDCVSIMCTEFPGNELGLVHDIIFFWIAFPFGRSASPGYFQTCARLITKLHCAYRPLSPVTGDFPFLPHMFVDDAMAIEVDFPRRLGQSENAWEACCETVLGVGSVSEDKEKIEWEWLGEAILLGSHVNVERKLIYLPDANVEGSKLVLSRPCYNDGNTVILLKALQELRGLFAHYSNCNQVWKTLARPIDSLLAYPDESSMLIRCEDVEIWRDFWNMIQFT